jgi:putative exporter of polyketide antibiotics
MVYSIIISILLAVLVVFLVFKLNQRAKQIEQLEKLEKMEWMLKVALEQSCQLPSVEAEELAKIEPELNRLMSNAKNDKGVEEKIRSLIMGLYEEKVGKAKKQV